MRALACAGLVFTIISAGRAQDASPRGWDDVVRFYEQRIREAGIVGSSLVLVHDGRVVAARQVGYQDGDAKRPVTPDTVFHWGSITKTFTGIAIMQLRDRGRLALDDPAVKYVPELRQVHNPFGEMSQVTIRHLMSHTSGFRAPTWPWGGDQDWHPFEPTRWEQVVAMFPYTTLLFPPGSRYSYSNPGVIVLGRIIETLSGDDYEMYVTKNILAPLGMSRSFFDRAPYHLLACRSHSYYRTDDGLREGRFDFDTGITVSNGGLNAPLADMARYLAFLMGDPQPPAARDAVIARASLEEMFQPVARASDGEGGSGEDARIGLSFFLERHLGLDLVAHSGSQGGFLSHFYLHLPTRTGFIVAYNTEVTTKKAAQAEVTRQVDAELRDEILRRVLGQGR